MKHAENFKIVPGRFQIVGRKQRIVAVPCYRHFQNTFSEQYTRILFGPGW